MLIYFLGKLVPAACSLFIMIAGVRFLGKAEFGRYNLLFNCINIAVTFFIGWIQQSMLRFHPGSGEENLTQRNQFMMYALTSSALASLVIFFLSVFYFEEYLVHSLVIAAFTFAFSLLSVNLTFLQSQFRSLQYALTESTFYFIAILALFAVICFSFPPEMIYFYGAWLTAGLAWMIVDGIRHSRAFQQMMRSGMDASFLKKSFQYGFLITAWLFVSNLFNVTDRFIIRYYFEYEQVGIYSVVYDFIYRLTSFATLPVLLTLHPLIMKTWNEDRRKESMALVRKAVLLLSLLMLAELIGYLIFGRLIFSAFFNIEDPGLMKLIIPLVLSSVLWQAALFLHKPLELLFRQRQMIIGIVISLGSNVVLNFIFIPLYGYSAAAYTTLASTLVYIIFVLLTRRLVNKTPA